MTDTRLREAAEWGLVIAMLALLAMAMTGCATTARTSTVEVERTRGVQAGQPVDLTTERRAQTDEDRRTTVDAEEVARKAAEAATLATKAAIASAVPGLGQALAAAIPAPPKVEVPTIEALAAGVLEAQAKAEEGKPVDPLAPLGGAAGAVGIGLALLAERRRRQSDRHLEETVAGVEAAKGILPHAEWLRLTNALQTRQSSDTQRRINDLTP